MNKLRFGFASLAFFVLRSAIACQAELSISSTPVLPATPARVTLTIINDRDVEQPFPASVAFLVRRAGQAAPFLLKGVYGYSFQLAHKGDLPLSRRERRITGIGSEPRVFGGNFTTHESFQAAGEYSVQVIFFATNPYTAADSPWSAPAPAISEVLQRAECVSNEATLRVAEPVGVDASVWKRIRSVAPRGAFDLETRGAAEVRAIFDEYPGSRYLPFLAVDYVTPVQEEKLRVYERALAAPADAMVKDLLRLKVASIHSGIAFSQLQRDPRSALRHADIADRIVHDVLNTTSDEVVKRVATRQADETASVASLQDILRERSH